MEATRVLLLVQLKVPGRAHEVHRERDGEGPRVGDLQARLEEDARRVEHELGAGRVVIAFDDDEVLVAGVSFVDLLGVVLPDEVVVFARHEKGRYEALVRVRDG